MERNIPKACQEEAGELIFGAEGVGSESKATDDRTRKSTEKQKQKSARRQSTIDQPKPKLWLIRKPQNWMKRLESFHHLGRRLLFSKHRAQVALSLLTGTYAVPGLVIGYLQTSSYYVMKQDTMKTFNALAHFTTCSSLIRSF